MKVLGKQVYRFEGVELDPSQGCLKRNGEELPLRQKSLQALVYLVEQRHRLVTKQELIERVWEGLAVTDDGLVQLIKEIRRSLGDDPRRPRFIKTVRKGGYRFIAPVEELYVDLPVDMEIERQASIEIEYEEEIIDETRERILPRPVARLLRPRLVVAALASLMLVGAISIYVATNRATTHGPSRKELAEVRLPELPGRKGVVVIYFDNRSASPDLDWLREGLADMLITNLARSKRLNVLSRQQLYHLIERSGRRHTDRIRLDDAMEIARRTSAEVIVMGSYVRLGEKIRIDVQLHSAENGQPIAAESITADKAQYILAQLDLLSLRLAADLGAAPEAEGSRARLDSSMTTSLEAYRYYSLAVAKAQALHNAEAIELLKKAIKLDSQFAMAHARIGYAYGVRGDFTNKAKPYLERAFQLSDRLSERDRLYIKGWYAIANLDYPGAIEVFEEIIAAYPMETEAYDRLSRLLMGEDRAEEALEVALRGLAVDAESADLLNQIGGVYSLLGRHDEAIAARQRYVAVAPNEPNAYDSLGLAYQWAGRYPEAIAAYQQSLALHREFELAVVHLANTYFQQGRYREAIEQYRNYIRVAPSDAERARGYGCIALVYLKQRDLERSRKAAEQSQTYSRQPAYYPIVVSLERGDLAAAEALSKQFFAYNADTNRGQRITQRYPHYLRGYVDLKSGRHEEALAEFKEALRHYAMIWHTDSFEDCLANAYLELGRLDEAIAEYERILRLNPNYPLAQYHVAQAYERKGEPARARASYERFLEIWKDADPDIPEVVAAKQRLSS